GGPVIPPPRTVAAALLLTALTGCGSSRPRAPALQDEPVFENKQEGLRFLAPNGWKMRARTEVPAGKLTAERLLVEYQNLNPDRPANLEVIMADVSPSIGLPECAESRGQAPEEWRKTGSESLEVGGLPAVRVTFADSMERPGKAERAVKEIVAVRRG